MSNLAFHIILEIWNATITKHDFLSDHLIIITPMTELIDYYGITGSLYPGKFLTYTQSRIQNSFPLKNLALRFHE